MIKLNAGFSRKVGEASFGSRGASVNLEIELDSSAAADGDKMLERIRSLFALAKKAVDEELHNGNGNNGTVKHDEKSAPAQTAPASPAPLPPAQPKRIVCSDCGTDRMSDKVVTFSNEQFGKPLCYRCQRKHGSNNGGRAQ